MNITILGTGYVGLVTGACFAEMGNRVVCVDVDQAKIDGLEAGRTAFFEPGLDALLAANRSAGRLAFTANAAEAVAGGEIVFLAVGTPTGDDGETQLEQVYAAARSIGDSLAEGALVVVKSTVPVGTTDTVQELLRAALRKRGADFEVAVLCNPEFLKEGAAVADFMKPDRVIIGSADRDAAARLEALYGPFNRNHDKVLHMDVRSAELTKYAANLMLATRISLMNEFANLAERVGADIEHVRLGVGSDPRIGHHFIYAGCGYGGSCLPKDARAVVHMAAAAGLEAELTRTVDAVNERQKQRLVDKAVAYFDGDLDGRTFALWGLAFKPNTSDMREAPSRVFMEALWARGACVRAYDPRALDEAQRLYGNHAALTLCERREDTLTGADALAVVTEWHEFRSLDLPALRHALRGRVVFDGRNLYDPATLAQWGIDHVGIGRGASAATAASAPSPAAEGGIETPVYRIRPAARR